MQVCDMVKRVIGCKYKITEGMDGSSSLLCVENNKTAIRSFMIRRPQYVTPIRGRNTNRNECWI